MERVDAYLDLLCRGLGRVDEKFVRTVVKGILAARSVNLSKIATALNENISLHATHKRLSRNLDNPSLQATLAQRLLELGSQEASQNTRLFVHTYSLNKKYAQKIEYLDQAQASGFNVCEVLASDYESNRYVPLVSHVWSSTVPGFVSDADEIKRTLRRVLKTIGQQSLIYLDDKSAVARAVASEFLPDVDFEILSLMQEKTMEVECNGKRLSLQAVSESIETEYGKIMFKLVPEGLVGTTETDMDLFMHVGTQTIKILESNRPMSLIALKVNSNYLGELQTIPIVTSRTKLRSRKSLMGLVESFLSMQDVIQTHVSCRDQFKPADFRVLSFNRLQLLLTLLLTALQVEASTQGLASQQIDVKPHDGDIHRTYLMPQEL